MIKHTAERPYIRFATVTLMSQYFWGHKQGCSAICLCQLILFQLPREPQVSDFEGCRGVFIIEVEGLDVLFQVEVLVVARILS